MWTDILFNAVLVWTKEKNPIIRKTRVRVDSSKRQHIQPTDLVSTGVEEVAQADYVAVVQLPHDLQLTVLNKKTKTQTTH